MNSPSKPRSELALLMSMNAKSEEYMRNIQRKTRGKWNTGRRVSQERLLPPATVYFYVTSQGRICYKATVEKIRRIPGKKGTELELSNIDDLEPSKDYNSFRKSDGSKIMGRNALQGIIYVLDLR